VAAWRKLKRMGAVLLQDAVWVLPDTPHTRENFQWLAAEIREQGSEAVIWEARCLLPGQDEELVQRFLAQVDGEYRTILDELERKDADLSALARRYQSLQAQDYFQSELGRQVRQALMDAAGGAES
jgi:hypothetical protein